MSSYSFRGSRRPGVANKNRRSPVRTNRRPGQQYIDPTRFVKVAVQSEITDYQAVNQFNDFAIADLLKSNLAAKGYVTPSPIQDQTIPTALSGRDVIGIANTGTGKTAAFAIPLLHKLMNDKSSRALIIAPTRELAEQIQDECRSIAKGSGLFGALLIGGTSMGAQLRDLKEHPRIVIGTPGRIKDHIERGTLKLAYFDVVVLDEVDRMLDMGFVADVRSILSQLSTPRQSFFFSATLDTRVQGLIQTFADNPVLISLKGSDTSEHVNQDVVSYRSSHEKLDKLHDILLKEDVAKIIVFDATQRSVERLSNELVSRGFAADAIHGGKSQGQRQRALSRFKKNEINILVATDVAARGIDVIDITHVINFSTPNTYEDYVHRIGRAGRAGRVGHALTFVSD
ncbi:MAG TPA: DEAD/DEAH box helicase [Candidatus Saccharimonadales bacterium]|nr:DEAD/DEAH box helicase [Candidatus Saccharimonadales bacterium]